MDFEKICMIFTMQEPYYGILLSSMERVPSMHLSTMAVAKTGNVFQLVYNPKFVESLDLNTTLECIRHEILHLAFNHFSLWEDNNVTPDIHKLRNIALDMEVNGYVHTDIMKGVSPVLAKDHGWENFLGGREYYKRLYQEAQQQKQQKQQAQQPSMPCNGGSGSENQEEENEEMDTQMQGQPSGNSPQKEQEVQSEPEQDHSEEQEIPQDYLDQFEPFDDHSQWPECGSEDETELLKQMVDDLLVFAAEEVEKAHGSIPSEMVGRVDNIKKKKPRPVADWKRYFRRYLGNEFSEIIRKSKKRESRRFPDAAGNRHRRKSHILVAIDTSGSVSMPEYREFFGQIRTLTDAASFHVVECDACIQHEYDFKGKPNDVLHGGGGTDFQPVVDLYHKDRKKYDALVYFTDGCCDIPHDTPKDTLWVISSEGDQTSRRKYQVNGASVVFIPRKK